MKKILVIGAGPAGLTAAYQLSKRTTVKVSVFEASNSVGGLSKSLKLWGQTVDLGPHRFFSKDNRINKLFHELAKGKYSIVNRKTRIYYNRRFFEYPLRFFNVLSNVSIFKLFRVVYFFGLQKVFPTKDTSTFESWIVSRFGKELYNMFFKNYTEKLWGIPCNRIDSDWAAQRIKKLTLFQAIKHSIFQDKNNTHKTLVDQFMYPKGGTGKLYDNAVEQIIENKGSVFLNQGVKRILLNESETRAIGIELMSGEKVLGDHMISTMPLTIMVKHLPGLPPEVKKAADSLYFRNTILVYLEVDRNNLFDDNWLYIHSNDVLHGRITNFSNWCPTLNANKTSTILCLEYWCFESDGIWEDIDSKLIELASKEVREIELVSEKDIILNGKVIKIPRSYPVYETGYSNNVNIIKKHLDKIENLDAIGRYGSFKYNNQDHSILMGLMVSDKVLGESGIDLWNVNSDDEYQEDAAVDVLTD
ncbi:FAD-dependent oxidoreductase [Arenibacter sp. F26102]|uniref:FAD-dependent oxidoreductase n=1 Tax=Arenibacter sp. F26102 TaxID=2926416 RepID=UPI001FF64B09|nr:FAD-dependent oxidoreductase [Arenibacter sp. F26102]MCK0144106.1 FAD-dependent oxidoreductase [Arenibacter sp. F26102]